MMDTYALPELGYGYDSLEPAYSAEILELHHGKHHAGYVKGANATLAALAEARDKGDFDALNLLQKNLAFNLSGHVLHSLFWQNLGPNGGGSPGGEFADALARDFGSTDGFREQMSAAAGSVQGSGWAALTWDPLGSQLLVQQIYDHQGNIGNGTLPIMVLDMWEHAFYLQYRNEKKRWIEAYWDIVHWQDVAERFAKIKAIDLDL